MAAGTELDFQQVIRNIYDEAANRIRTDAATVLDGGDLDVSILHTEDSIRLGDGTNFLTSTTIGSDVGLDVNIINPISVEIDAADGDNIAIHDSDGDELEINPDGTIDIRNITGTVSLPTGAATSANQLTEISHLSSIDTDIDVALSTRASEATLSTLNSKIANNYGAASGAVRTASQIGNTTGAADFNAGTTGAQTLRTSSNITRNGTELSYNGGVSDGNTLRTASNLYDGSGTALTSTLFNSDQSLDVRPNTGFATGANTRPSINNVSSNILASNPARKYAYIFNQSGVAIFIKLGAAAVINQGIRIPDNSMYEINSDNLWTGDIFAIKNLATAVNIEVFEGTI